MAEENPYYQGMDAYQILGVPRNADRDAIKSAFRKQVATWHPDKFPNDPEKKKEGNLRMEKINRAWYILGDDDRKRRYDTYGERGVGTSASSEERLKKMGGPGGFGGGFGGADFGDFNGAVDIGDISDIFESFFGGGGGMGGGGMRGRSGGSTRSNNVNAPMRGEDVEVELEIPFMTSIFGGRETVRVRRMEECKTCSGSGLKPGAKIKQCRVCNGQGQTVNMQRTPFGAFQTISACANCRGSGQEYEDFCGNCRGRGATSETADVALQIPVGVEAGTTLRVREGGSAGRKGGPRGDLITVLKVRKDPKFTRQGLDILSEENVSFVDAVLGTTISAETVDGKVEVRIPQGTQPGQKLRIRGAGAPRTGGNLNQRGDAIITVKVNIPTALSDSEKELMEKLKALQKK